MSAQFGDDFADDIRNTEAAREDESVEDIPSTHRRKKSAAMDEPGTTKAPGEGASQTSPPSPTDASVGMSSQRAAGSNTSMAADAEAAERKDAKEDWVIDLDHLDHGDAAAAQRQGEYNQRMLDAMRYQMLLAAVMAEPSKAEGLLKALDKCARAQGVDSEGFIRDVTSAENVTATIQELYPELYQALLDDIDKQEATVREAFTSAGLSASSDDIRTFCVVAAYQDRFPPAHGLSVREQIQKMAGPIGKALGNPNVQVALGTIAVTMATGGVGTVFAAAGLARSLINHPRMESINAKFFEMAQRHAPAPMVSATKALQDATKRSLNSKAFSWLSKGRIAAGIVMGVAFVAMGGADRVPDLLKSAADALDANGTDAAGPADGSELASLYSAVYAWVNDAMESGYAAGMESEVALADQPAIVMPEGFSLSGGSVEYTVSTEDSKRGLWGIADRYLESQGVINPTDTQIANMVNDIVDANAAAHPELMTNRDLIHAGQSLMMPVSPDAAVAATPITSPLPKVDMSSIGSLEDAPAMNEDGSWAGSPFKKGFTTPSM
jgi:hypothetical protein